MEQRARRRQTHLLYSTKHTTSYILIGFVHYFCFDLEVDNKKSQKTIIASSQTPLTSMFPSDALQYSLGYKCKISICKWCCVLNGVICASLRQRKMHYEEKKKLSQVKLIFNGFCEEQFVNEVLTFSFSHIKVYPDGTPGQLSDCELFH